MSYIMDIAPNMLNLERIPDQVGYLVLTEDGAVVASGGELENDEHVANVVTGLITIADKVDPVAFQNEEAFKRVSVIYDDHCYVICLSNKKIHVVKRKFVPNQVEPVTV
ncbi:ragulator complex protein LAMTOR4 isoform X1 [Schistocerca nitens]|uniref:ragulator complex protein LAMTOR4 isoform X1 n=2 Tax=Schistocerca nitens TaxID=7011 RepID=UPI002118C190|nr:ragulator complex protein LAMTOR4 isoform X1 [Schistocerca nitens]